MEATQADLPLRSLARYLETGHFADAVICFSGFEQKVHRLVLAQGSDYFSNLFLSPFKEANSWSIDLSGDDPEAIRYMIAHLYGHEVVITGISSSEGGFQIVKTQIEMFVAGNKYLVPTLCRKIEECFEDNLTRLLERIGLDLNFVYIEKIARILYIDHEIAAQRLQAPLISLLAVHVAELTENTDFRELNADVPEMAFHLLTAVSRPKKVALLKLKKRKV